MKSSLEYVCLYTDFTSGRKALMIRKKFGLLGHAMLSEVVAWIGAMEGWYADWTDETADLFATTRMFDLSLSDQVRDVLIYMVEIGFFSPAAFKEHHVLTSPILYKFWAKAKEGAARKAKMSVQKYLDQCVPEGSKLWKIRETLIAENPDLFAQTAEKTPQTPEKNAQTPEKNAQTPEKTPQTPGFSAQSKVKESKVKDLQTSKQTNKQQGVPAPEYIRRDFSGGCERPARWRGLVTDLNELANSAPNEALDPGETSEGVIASPGSGSRVSQRADAVAPGETSTGVIASPGSGSWQEAADEARGRENWTRARDLAKESLFFRGISADLIDAAAVCLVHGWLGIKGLHNIRRKARDALDTHEQSRGRRGKANGWETVRDCVSLVIREQGLDPPTYSRKNPEPPQSLGLR